jgi:hypothetical protein
MDASESGTMDAEEQDSYEEAQTDLVTAKCAPSQGCYTEHSCALVTHSPSSPSASDDDDEQGRPHRQIPQQLTSCAGHCSVTLQCCTHLEG